MGKPAKSHCKHGHELSDANVRNRVRKDGERHECKTCQRAMHQKWKRKVRNETGTWPSGCVPAGQKP